jgi:hypothetical protein
MNPRKSHGNLLLLLIWLAGTLWFLLWALRGLDIVDEGFTAVCAQKILAGAIPHRDFFSIWPAGVYLLNALLYAVLGQSLLWGRLLIAGLASAMLAFMLDWGKRAMPPCWLGILPGLFFIAWGTPMFNLMQPGWLAVGMGLASVTFGLSVLAHPTRAKLFWGGLMLGLSIVFKHNIGLLLAIVWVFLLFNLPLEREKARGWWLWFLYGVLLPVVPLLVWLGANGALGQAYQDLIVLPQEHRTTMWIGQPLLGWLELGLLVLAMLLATSVLSKRFMVRWGSVIITIAIVSLVWAQYGQQALASALNAWVYHLPWGGLGLGFFLGILLWKGEARKRLLLGSAFLLAIHLQIFPRSDQAHLTFSLATACLVWLLILENKSWWGKWRPAMISILTLFMAMAAIPAIIWQFSNFFEVKTLAEEKRLVLDERIVYPDPRAPFLVKPAEVTDVLALCEELDARLKPGEPLIALPVQAGVLFLTAHDFPGRYNHFMPGYLTNSDQQEEIRLWKEKNLQYIVKTDFQVNGLDFEEYCPIIDEYITQNYLPVKTIGRFTILKYKGLI